MQSLSIAGLSFRFESLPGRLPSLFKPFCEARASGEPVPVRLEIARRIDPAANPPDFEGGELWNYQGGRYRRLDYDLAPGKVLTAQLMTVESGPLAVSIRQLPAAGFPLRFPLGELLLTEALTQTRGALVHACGIKDGKRGFLFSGRSGAGKTTTARLWRKAGAQVLNDDRVALRLVGRTPMIYGTPWPGELGIAVPAGAPLRAVLFLKQAPENSLRKVAPAQAAARLVRASFVPLWSKAAMERVLESLEAILRKTPAFEFSFRKDQGSVAFLRQELA